MKRTLISIAASLGCLLFSSIALTAQGIGWGYNVPFSFSAEGVQMPAGYYKVSKQSQTLGSLRGNAGSISFVRHAQLAARPGKAHLTFYKYGNNVFLREVWEETGVGTKIPESAREREVRAREQQARVQPETVELLASR
jgi:hypothetical protein